PTDFDAQELITELAAGHTTSEVPVTAAAGPITIVTADRSEIRRAISNLVDNAVRHAQTHVQLELTHGGDSVTVHVLDDGPGIPAEDRRRVFDRFTRLDTARDSRAGGTGLGLSIVDEL